MAALLENFLVINLQKDMRTCTPENSLAIYPTKGYTNLCSRELSRSQSTLYLIYLHLYIFVHSPNITIFVLKTWSSVDLFRRLTRSVVHLFRSSPFPYYIYSYFRTESVFHFSKDGFVSKYSDNFTKYMWVSDVSFGHFSGSSRWLFSQLLLFS
jgi:hypothetical protein